MTDAPQISATQPPLLSYARRPRRWKRYCLMVLTVAVALIVWQWPAVRSFAAVRYAVWQTYRSQSACEAASLAVGEVVVRTDGKFDGVRDAAALPLIPGRPRPLISPVTRQANPALAFLRQCDRLSQLARSQRTSFFGLSGPMAGNIPRHLGGFRYPANSTLIDCRRQKNGQGATVLAWVTLEPSFSGGLSVWTATTALGTAVRPPQEIGTNSNATSTTVEVDCNPLGGPVVVRRTAAARPEDVRLALEYGGGTSFVTATWAGDHYDVQAEPGPQVMRNPNSGGLWLRVVPQRAPLVEREHQKIKLPDDFAMPRAIAADDGGLVIQSDYRGGGFQGQVHRLNFADHRVVELLPPSRSLSVFRAALSQDGRRITGFRSDDPEGPSTIILHDLRSGKVFQGDSSIAASEKSRHVRAVDDGKTLLLSTLREPIWQLDGELRVVRRIPSQRADWLMPNGRYVARLTSDTLDFYDLQTGTWSPPLEKPFGANEAYPSPDGRMVCCKGTDWSVLDAASGQVITSLLAADDSGGQIGDAAVFSPDGRWLAIAGLRVYLIDLLDPDRPKTYEVEMGFGQAERSLAAFTLDSRSLILQREATVRFYHLNELKARPRTVSGDGGRAPR